MLDAVEDIRKEIRLHEYEYHCNLVMGRELNRGNAIVLIWSFKRNRAPNIRSVNHKACLCDNGGMK